MIEQTDLTIRDMREVKMQTVEPFYSIEATERLVKILDITYEKSDLEQVANNTTHMNADEITQLQSLQQDFGDLFDGTI